MIKTMGLQCTAARRRRAQMSMLRRLNSASHLVCIHETRGVLGAIVEVQSLYSDWEVHEGPAVGRSGGIRVIRKSLRAHVGECHFDLILEGRLMRYRCQSATLRRLELRGSGERARPR